MTGASMTTLLRSSVAIAALSAVLGCGPTGPTAAIVCDKNSQVNQTFRLGDCTRIPEGTLYGDPTTCRTAAEKCTADDRVKLLDVLNCAEKLPVCSESAKEAWVGARTGCVMRLMGVTAECNNAFQGILPDPSGIFDAGAPDAGPVPFNDGGSALELVVVADETSFAFAWTPLQQVNDVTRWAFLGISDAGVRDEPFFADMSSRRDFVLADAGLNQYRRWFMIGEGVDAGAALGRVDAGQVMMADDAGMRCSSPLECPTNLVCDLGRCRVQTCQPGGPATCPGAYQCFTDGTCNRTGNDAGFLVIDAGATEMSSTPLPFISNEAIALIRAPVPAEPIVIGGFPGKRPDLVAVDSARQIVSLEQEGQLIGHTSFRRGKDFPSDSLTATSIDTVGTRARLAYNAESRTLFACYTVGRGIRVRRSLDEGRTWLEDAVTLEASALPDGGLGNTMGDCDVAPWRQGGALMVSIDEDRLVVRNITRTFEVEDAGQIAYAPGAPDAGPFSLLRPSIATLPSDSQVHIVFTGSRLQSSGLTDSETYGIYRDGNVPNFTPPSALPPSLPGAGNPLPQDHATVVIDPKTKRALSAHATLLSGTQGINSVQLSVFDPVSRQWFSRAGLNVFATATDNVTRFNFPFPEFQGRDLDAFSPVLTALPNGKIWLTVVAGPRLGPGAGNDFRLWAIPFDWSEPDPLATGTGARGWFKPPARKLSDLRVWDPRGGGLRPTTTAFAADSQVSFYGVFTEGFGAGGDVEGGRAHFVSVP